MVAIPRPSGGHGSLRRRFDDADVVVGDFGSAKSASVAGAGFAFSF